MLCGKQVILKANEYIYIQCGMSAAALLPEEIHIKGTKIQLDSPLNEQEETVFGDNALKELKAMYFEAKWGSPMQLFMPDGTPIGREYSLEENEALKKYFLDHVLGTEGYKEYLSTPELRQLYDEGVFDDEGEKLYNDNLYSKWLTETYGKTEWQKFKDWVTTKEGMHTSLDVMGILLEPADALNAVLYLMEKDWGNAALSGISMLPFMGEQFGKAGKGTKKYLLKAADATKLNRNEKFVKMLDNLDIFIKARKADIEDIRRWMRSLDNLADGGGYVIEYVTPDGLIYKVRMNDDFRVNINLMNGSGGSRIKRGSSTLNDWVDKISDLSKQAPIEIPSSATVKIQAKNGYDQISFKWTENGKNYEVRWHTKTPGAPEGQGNTWVVSRVTPGTPTGQVRTEHILVGDTWVSRYQWQEAINANKNGTATLEQLQLLKDGHWQAP